MIYCGSEKRRSLINANNLVWNGAFLNIGQCASFFFFLVLRKNICTTPNKQCLDEVLYNSESYSLLYLLLKYSLLLLTCCPSPEESLHFLEKYRHGHSFF